jgi:hypothetical protein
MTPDLLGAFRGRRKERFISFVGLVVLLDEITNIDLFAPEAWMKPLPRGNRFSWAVVFILSPFFLRS